MAVQRLPLVNRRYATASRRPRWSVGRFLRFSIAVVMAVFFVAPIVLAAFGGLKSEGELELNPLGLPEHPAWSNYTTNLTSSVFWDFFKNSAIVMVFVTLGVIVSCSMAAFVFARLRFRGKDIVFGYFMLGLLFPLAVAVLPLFVLLRNLHLIDSLLGLILVEMGFLLPTSLLLLRSFFVQAVPREIQEAAYMDGCKELGFFLRILLPMARPAIAAVAVITMVTSWNMYFLPLLVINTPSKWPLPLGIAQYQSQFGTNWPAIMAFVTLSLIPTIIFYLFAERHLVAGLSAGAVKG